MDCIQAINERRSVRRFKSDNINRTLIEQILKAAQMAPSAGNLQARDFVVVTDTQVKERLADAALGQDFISTAPAVVVVCANLDRAASRYGARGELYAIEDASAAVENLMLAAHALGLATCWIGAFSENGVSEILGLPERVMPVALIPAGYAAVIPAAPPRFSPDRVVHYEHW